MKTKAGAAVLEIKALEENGVFSGYGSIFGNKDAYGDVVVAGAFAKSLADHRRKGTKPKMFWQHNPHEPIGSWTDAAEDGKGLWLEGRLNMEVQRAREAYALLKAEDIDGLSIGYQVVSAEPDEKAGVLRLKELRLAEVSIVSIGANDRALIDSVKHFDALQNWKAGVRPQQRELEDFLKEHFSVSNSEAERMANALLNEDRGGRDQSAEPTGSDFAAAFAAAMASV